MLPICTKLVKLASEYHSVALFGGMLGAVNDADCPEHTVTTETVEIGPPLKFPLSISIAVVVTAPTVVRILPLISTPVL